jgi:uncharacterized protein with ParB-like and HNH nuclease domain
MSSTVAAIEKEYKVAEREAKKGVTAVKSEWMKKINKVSKRYEKTKSAEDEAELHELVTNGDKAVKQAEKDSKKTLTQTRNVMRKRLVRALQDARKF